MHLFYHFHVNFQVHRILFACEFVILSFESRLCFFFVLNSLPVSFRPPETFKNKTFRSLKRNCTEEKQKAELWTSQYTIDSSISERTILKENIKKTTNQLFRFFWNSVLKWFPFDLFASIDFVFFFAFDSLSILVLLDFVNIDARPVFLFSLLQLCT